MNNANAPAYPTRAVCASSGLTKREEFAKAAMQGLLASTRSALHKQFAEESVYMADAMLAELAKPVQS